MGVVILKKIFEEALYVLDLSYIGQVGLIISEATLIASPTSLFTLNNV